MDKDTLLKQADDLREKIRRAQVLYYEKDAPEISDYEYDALFAELKKLEEDYNNVPF